MTILAYLHLSPIIGAKFLELIAAFIKQSFGFNDALEDKKRESSTLVQSSTNTAIDLACLSLISNPIIATHPDLFSARDTAFCLFTLEKISSYIAKGGVTELSTFNNAIEALHSIVCQDGNSTLIADNWFAFVNPLLCKIPILEVENFSGETVLCKMPILVAAITTLDCNPYEVEVLDKIRAVIQRLHQDLHLVCR